MPCARRFSPLANNSSTPDPKANVYHLPLLYAPLLQRLAPPMKHLPGLVHLRGSAHTNTTRRQCSRRAPNLSPRESSLLDLPALTALMVPPYIAALLNGPWGVATTRAARRTGTAASRTVCKGRPRGNTPGSTVSVSCKTCAC